MQKSGVTCRALDSTNGGNEGNDNARCMCELERLEIFEGSRDRTKTTFVMTGSCSLDCGGVRKKDSCQQF